jgi:uncharacterized OB-fold protein
MTRLPASGRLRPQATADSAFFWDAAAAGRLDIQRCTACQALRFPPGPACPHCHCLEWEAIRASGKGRLFSYTVVRHPVMPGFQGPAVVAIVELEEGVRMATNIDIDADSADDLVIGEPLEVFFLPQAEGWSVPQFRRVPRLPARQERERGEPLHSAERTARSDA